MPVTEIAPFSKFTFFLPPSPKIYIVTNFITLQQKNQHFIRRKKWSETLHLQFLKIVFDSLFSTTFVLDFKVFIT